MRSVLHFALFFVALLSRYAVADSTCGAPLGPFVLEDIYSVSLVSQGTDDGSVVFTTSSTPNVYLLDPSAPVPKPMILFSIPNAMSGLGIAETSPNVFAIVAGNYTNLQATNGSDREPLLFARRQICTSIIRSIRYPQEYLSRPSDLAPIVDGPQQRSRPSLATDCPPQATTSS